MHAMSIKVISPVLVYEDGAHSCIKIVLWAWLDVWLWALYRGILLQQVDVWFSVMSGERENGGVL